MAKFWRRGRPDPTLEEVRRRLEQSLEAQRQMRKLFDPNKTAQPIGGTGGINRPAQASSRGGSSPGGGTCTCSICTRTRSYPQRTSSGLAPARIFHMVNYDVNEIDLPHERSTVPLLGVRRSRIFVNMSGGVSFCSSVIGPVPYKSGDRARCLDWNALPHRQVPDVSCNCGFYAIANPRELYRHATFGVDLWVEMYGRVIEHDKGFRAEYIRFLHGGVKCDHPGCTEEGASTVLEYDQAYLDIDRGSERWVGEISGMSSTRYMCRPHTWHFIRDSSREVSEGHVKDARWHNQIGRRLVVPTRELFEAAGVPYEIERYW